MNRIEENFCYKCIFNDFFQVHTFYFVKCVYIQKKLEKKTLKNDIYKQNLFPSNFSFWNHLNKIRNLFNFITILGKTFRWLVLYETPCILPL